MHHRTTRARSTIVVAILLLLTAACGGGDDEPGGGNATGKSGGTPIQGGSLNYVIQAAPPTSLDNVSSSATAVRFSSSASWFYALYGALVYEDYEAGDVKPWMAESLTMKDPTHWTLSLRQGVTFSDNTPLDAEAVKFNWDRIMTTPTAAQRRSVVPVIETVTVADPRTLDITLKAPNVAFDRIVARFLPFVGSPTAIKADAAAFAKAPVAAGPFRVRSFNSTTFELVAERNASYWDKPRPYLDQLTIRTSRDPQQAFTTWQSGEAQMLNTFTPDLYGLLKGAGESIETISAPISGQTLLFNTARAPFNDKDMRRAFMQALDREAMNTTLNSGLGTVDDTLADKDSPYHNGDAAFPKHDKAAAQKLIDAYVQKTGGPVKLVFAYATSPQLDAAGNYLVAAFQGIKNVTIQLTSAQSSGYGEALAAGAFDIAYFSWSADDPLLDFIDFFGKGGLRNSGKYSNPEVDRLLAEAAGTVDKGKRAAILRKVQDIVVTQDNVAWFIYNLANAVVKADTVGDAPYASDGIWLWDRVWVGKK